MNESCINPNSPKFKILLEHGFSKETAYTMTLLHQEKTKSDGIPTPEEAESLYRTSEIKERDDAFSKSPNDFKIEKFTEERTRLKDLIDPKKLTAGQISTINALIGNLEASINRLKSGEKFNTVSASKLAGQKIFQQDLQYAVFGSLGNFVHSVMEFVVEKGLGTGKVSSISREDFDTLFEDYKIEKTFNTLTVDKDDIFNLINGELIPKLSVYGPGTIFIPEISVVGSTANKELSVVGRIDLLAIQPSGIVEVIDFKTKKVAIKDGRDIISAIHSVLGTAKSKQGNKVQDQKGTIEEFRNKNFSDLELWQFQLRIYENILSQIGIQALESKIIAYFYKVDAKGIANDDILSWQNYESLAVEVYTSNTHRHLHDSINWNFLDFQNKPEELDNSLKRNLEIIDREMGIITEETREGKLNLPFTFNGLDLDQFLKILNTTVETAFAYLDTLSQSGQASEEEDKLSARRKVSIKAFQDYVASYNEKDPRDEAIINMSVHYNNALNTLNDELSFYKDKIKLIEEKDYNVTPEDKLKDLTVHNRIMDFTIQYSELFSQLKEIYNRALNQDRVDNNIGIKDTLSKIEANLSYIESVYRDKMIPIAITTIGGSFTQGQVERTTKAFAGIVLERLKYNKDQRDKLTLAGLSGFDKLQGKVFSFLSKQYKKDILKLGKNNFEDGLKAKRLLELDLLIKRDELLLGEKQADGSYTGIKVDQDFLIKYISGVTDLNSPLYIGHSNYLPSYMKGLFLDKGIASASNSDIIISSFVAFFKNTLSLAEQELNKQFILKKFDDLREKILSIYSPDEVNRLISEEVTVEVFDRQAGEDGEYKNRTSFNLVSPYSLEYRLKYFSFTKEIRELKKGRKKLREMIGTDQLVDGKDQLKEITKKIMSVEDDFLNWKIANVNDYYKDEIYANRTLIPTEERLELWVLKDLIDSLTYTIENSANPKEDDYEELQQKTIEYNKQRQLLKTKYPEYANYLDNYEDYYEKSFNENYFNTILNQKKSVLDEIKFEEWLNENKPFRPTKEWYDRLDEIRQDRISLAGSDFELESLFQALNAIKKNHFFNGNFDSFYMTEEELNNYQDIQDKIESRLSDLAASGGLSKEVKAELRQLSIQKDEIVDYRLSRHYIKRYNSFEGLLIGKEEEIARLIKGRDNSESIDEINNINSQIVVLEEQFLQDKIKFIEWFNKNHTPPKNSKGFEEAYNFNNLYELRSQKVPHQFNYETFPKQDKHFERTPHPKYFLNKIKEEWVNPDYIEGPEKIPMPKGIEYVKLSQPANADERVEGYYRVIPGFENSVYINKKFLDIQNNPPLFEFYNTLSNMFFTYQSKVVGRKTGYSSPGYVASSTENLFTKGLVRGMKDTFNSFTDRVLKVDSKQDELDNRFGDSAHIVRLKHNTQVRDEEGNVSELQSRDIVSSIMMWVSEANYNIALQRTVPYSDALINQLETLHKQIVDKPEFSDRSKQLSNAIDIIKNERNKFIKGQTDNATNRGVKKFIDTLMSSTSFIRIGFDFANQSGNWASAQLQSFIGAGLDTSSHYTQETFLKSFWAYYSEFVPSYFKDYNNVSKISLTTQMFRLYNPTQQESSNYLKDYFQGKNRKVLGKLVSVDEMSHFLQSKGDEAASWTVMNAILESYTVRLINPDGSEQLDSNGNPKTIKLKEAYVLNSDNIISLRSDIAFSLEDQNGVIQIIRNEIRRAQGNYASADKTPIEMYTAGKLAYFYRKFVVPAILNRFGTLRTNWEGQNVAIGYWNAVFHSFKYSWKDTLYRLIFGGFVNLDKFTPGVVRTNVYSKYITHASRELWFAVILGLLVSLIKDWLSSLSDDEKDDPDFIIKGNIARIIWKVSNETTSMTPLLTSNEEYIKNFTNVTTYTRELVAVGNMLNHAGSLGLVYILNGGDEPDEDSSFLYDDAWKDAFYSKKSGPYVAGDPKLKKDFYDLSGMKNIRDLFNPQNRLEILSKMSN
jgi:hypothetical protein